MALIIVREFECEGEAWRRRGEPALEEMWSAGLAVRAAQDVLGAADERGADAQVALQAAVEAALKRARDALPGPIVGADAGEVERERDGMHERDAAAVDFLRTIDPDAAETWAKEARGRYHVLRAQAELPGTRTEPEAWAQWRENDRWQWWLAKFLAKALWTREVRAAVEAKRPRKPAALSLLLVNDLSNVYLSPRNTVRVSDAGDGRASAAILSPNGEQLAATPVLHAGEIERAQRGVEVFRSYLGQLTLRRLPIEVWQRHVAGDRNSRVLSHHGITGILEWLGVSQKYHSPMLALLRAGQDFRRTWADNGRLTREVGGLWSYDLDERAGPGKHARLEINVNRPLAPFFVCEELERGDDRTLVPLVPMPPTVGSPNLWAGQAAFQFQIVRRLVEERTDVATCGGALLASEDLARLAVAAGMKPADLARVLDRWLSTAEGDAVLERVDRDRYHLADNAPYGQARRYITDTGRLSERKRKAGQAAARNPGRRRRAK